MEPLLTDDSRNAVGWKLRVVQWLSGGHPASEDEVAAANTSTGVTRQGSVRTPRSAGGREGDFPAAGGEMLRLGAFVGLLFTGWLLQKGLCQLGIPADCDGNCIPSSSAANNHSGGRPHNTRCGEAFANGWLGHLEGLQRLLSYGSIAGLLLGVHRPQRHRYLLTGRLLPAPPAACRLPGWWPIVYLVTIPIFSLVMNTKLFEGSLQRGSKYPTGLRTLDCTVLVMAIVLAGWHIWYGLRWCGGYRGFLFGFLLPRVGVFAWYGAYYAILVPLYASGDDDGSWHVPHWIAAFLLGIGCRWNHVLSALPLAVCLAIFTQGLAAYDIDPMIAEEHCVHFVNAQPGHTGEEVAVSAFNCSSGSGRPSYVDICVRSGPRVRCDGW